MELIEVGATDWFGTVRKDGFVQFTHNQCGHGNSCSNMSRIASKHDCSKSGGLLRRRSLDPAEVGLCLLRPAAEEEAVAYEEQGEAGIVISTLGTLQMRP